MAETQAAKSEPLTAFPWRGFYGGKVTRICVEYDDMSSTNIGGPESLQALQDAEKHREGDGYCRGIESVAASLREAMEDAIDVTDAHQFWGSRIAAILGAIEHQRFLAAR